MAIDGLDDGPEQGLGPDGGYQRRRDQPPFRRDCEKQRRKREDRQRLGGSADRESRIIDRLNREVLLAAEPKLAGKLQGMRQRQTHGNRSQQCADELKNRKHRRESSYRN